MQYADDPDPVGDQPSSASGIASALLCSPQTVSPDALYFRFADGGFTEIPLTPSLSSASRAAEVRVRCAADRQEIGCWFRLEAVLAHPDIDGDFVISSSPQSPRKAYRVYRSPAVA
jgi:hypothetical protein